MKSTRWITLIGRTLEGAADCGATTTPSRYGAVIGHAASYAFAASIRGFVLFGDDRYCVDLHERAWASVSCGGNDRDGCAVIAPH
jgi:hypothetical protein